MQEGIQVSKVYENVTISKEIYGNSFKVKLGKGAIEGFLHKTHAVLTAVDQQEEQKSEDEDDKKQKKGKKDKKQKIEKKNDKELS